MDVAAAQSGSSAGAPAVRKFPFAFDTPGLLTGATVYTPTVGDLLLDLWIEIDTTWDGTTPLCDVGMFIGANRGWFAYNGSGAVNMALTADSTNGFGYGVLSGGPVSLAQNLALSGAYGGNRQLPARFTIADPVKVVVSQDGTNTGANPGSTQGAAVLYVVTATPA
jgi:hypothetical protein